MIMMRNAFRHAFVLTAGLETVFSFVVRFTFFLSNTFRQIENVSCILVPHPLTVRPKTIYCVKESNPRPLLYYNAAGKFISIKSTKKYKGIILTDSNH